MTKHVCASCGATLRPETPGEGVSHGVCAPCALRLYGVVLEPEPRVLDGAAGAAVVVTCQVHASLVLIRAGLRAWAATAEQGLGEVRGALRG